MISLTAQHTGDGLGFIMGLAMLSAIAIVAVVPGTAKGQRDHWGNARNHLPGMVCEFIFVSLRVNATNVIVKVAILHVALVHSFLVKRNPQRINVVG